MVQKQFLVQKFARLPLGLYTIVGYSVAGEETCIQVPELNVCFDIGRCPYFALTSDIVCITHGHMDHLAGVGYYLSQRSFQGMKPGKVLVPREIHRGVDALLRAWRDVERQGTPYELIPMSAGETYEVRRDFLIRALQTHHGGPSLGYSLVSVREKLKPEYMGIDGAELARMKQQGTEIQYRLEVPIVTGLGDTTIGPVFDHPDVQNAETLLTEVTFFESDHKHRAKVGKHLHVDHFVEILPKLKNKHIVITHVSRRTGIGKAMRTLARRISPQDIARIHFLMDLKDAVSAGEIEDQGPPPKTEGE
jgi:ribonuclease Z